MNELLSSGLELMAVGMGTVFFFLTLLVFATTGMSALIRRYFPAAVPVAQTDAEQARHVAAITAAISLHRQRRDQRQSK